MKAIDQFRVYLRTDYRNQNGKSFNSKIASDYASRLRRLDLLFAKPIDDGFLLKEDSFCSIVNETKTLILKVSRPERKVKYPHQTYIIALHRYREYLLKRRGK